MVFISVKTATAITDVQNITYLQPWWNRPLWGESNVFDALMFQLKKQKIPATVMALHHRRIKELHQLAQQARKLELEVFKSREFLLFLRLNKNFACGFQQDKILHRSTQLLLVALQVKSIFQEMDKIKLEHLNLDRKKFHQLFPTLIHDEYLNHYHYQEQLIKKFAQDLSIEENQFEYYLNFRKYFFRSFARKKTFNASLYLLLQEEQISSDLLEQLVKLICQVPGDFLIDSKTLMALVQRNHQLFERISQISFIFPSKLDHQAYAKIIQYLALWYKYQLAYSQFKATFAVWQSWEKFYQEVVRIKRQYNAHEYRQPKDWQLPIPGLNLYKQYIARSAMVRIVV